MGAVADFVSDVVDSVGDVFEAVGDVVEDVVEFVGDAVEKVGEVVQAVIDDPLPTLLAVGGSFVGIPPWVTMGTVTAARGGDLEDIALSMGTAYIGAEIAPSISNSISSTVSSTFVEAGINETVSQLAGDAISKGLVNGTLTEVRGGDFEDGFAGGFTGTLVAGGVSEVASYVKPDIVEMAMDSGIDLRDATAVYNAGVKAVGAGITAEVTGRGDFATSFTTSAVGSGVDYGARELNATIDDQFKSVSNAWNEEDKDGEKIDTAVTTGAGIPDDLVTQVKVSDTGIDTASSTSTFDAASVLGDTFNRDTDAGSVATADAGSTVPAETAETVVAQAPTGETTSAFQDLISSTGATSDDNVLDDTLAKFPSDVVDIAETFPEDSDENAVAVVDGVPTGALASVSDAIQPDVLSNIAGKGATVVADAPASENLFTNTLAQDKPAEQPTGGLNAVSTAPQDKTTASLGLKPTDFTKPLVATVGNLIKSSLTQKKRPTTVKPTGGLQTASVRPKVSTPPPQKVNVANLIPIQKAPTAKKPTTVGPPKTLASNANLSPVGNIAGLTSMVKKVG